MSTHDAGNPLTEELTPLLVCDVWEHAYYVDRRNDRGSYVDAFLGHLVNWDTAIARWTKPAAAHEEL